MREPTPSNSRLLIATSLAVVIALGGGGFLLGRGTAPEAPPPAVVATRPPVVAADATPTINILNRADVIALGNAAADAAASGTPAATDLGDAIGKRFDLLLPFGCIGPMSEDSNAPLRWNYDAESSTLRIHVEPAIWQPDVFWGDQRPAGIDALEGFWIAQPWSSRATCRPTASATATAPGMEPVTLPGQTLGVAQILTAVPHRSQRQGQPYKAALRINRANLDISQGLQLRVTGRIGKFPNGAPTRCIQPAGSEQRPICIVAIIPNEVSFVNPTATAPIATWSIGDDIRNSL